MRNETLCPNRSGGVNLQGVDEALLNERQPPIDLEQVQVSIGEVELVVVVFDAQIGRASCRERVLYTV